MLCCKNNNYGYFLAKITPSYPQLSCTKKRPESLFFVSAVEQALATARRTATASADVAATGALRLVAAVVT